MSEIRQVAQLRRDRPRQTGAEVMSMEGQNLKISEVAQLRRD